MNSPAEAKDLKPVAGTRQTLRAALPTLLYVLFGGVWIVCSDLWLLRLNGHPVDSPMLSTIKGLNFIGTTGAILFYVLQRAYTRRDAAEKASHLNAERFELAARAASDALWDWNLVTNDIWWGDGFHTLFGHAPEDLEPSIISWTNRIHPDDKERTVAGIHKVIDSGGEAWSDEYRFRRKDGSYAHIYDRGYVIRQNGKPVRMVGGMSDISARKEAEDELRSSRHQLRALSARLESLREEERTRIAREIHDELGQMLTGLKMDLRWIEKKVGEIDGNPALNPVIDKAVEAGELADQTITAVQRIAAELRPGVLDQLGLFPALKHEGQRFQKRTGIACKVELPQRQPELPAQVATAVFRIFQETLTNVARHAEATEVRVTFREEGSRVILEVADNGRGLPADALGSPKALGLLGMQERAAVLGGDVQFQSGPGRGTTVTLRLPLTATDTDFLGAI
jgi:PAS domain S-box-containing protein